MSATPTQPHWTQLLGLTRTRAWLLVIFLATLGIGGWLAWPRVQVWHRENMFSRAQAFRSNGDLRSAVLMAKALLHQAPGHPGATRLMAEMAEETGSDAAAEWRGYIAQLEPTTANHLAWANTALRLGNLVMADHALSRIPKAERDTLEFTKAAASLALLRNQRSLAERLLQTVARLAPEDAVNQLNLAAVRLTLGRTNEAPAALTTLERLTTNPVVRLPALRSLIAESQRRGETNRAVQLVTELAHDTRATLNDQLLHLQVLRLAKAPDFLPKLERLQKAASLAEDIAAVSGWMVANGMAAEAEKWLAALPGPVRINQPLPVALAETYAVQEKWAQLEAFTKSGDWDGGEYLRLAFQTRALRARSDEVSARKAWRQSVNAAQRSPKQLATLARQAGAWNWNAETEELWWLLASGPAEQWPALQSLLRHYTARGETRQLLRVCKRILDLNPADATAKNNVAMLGLLLREDVATAHRLAEDNYRAQPGIAAFGSTYAFSLLQQHRGAEAETVMRSLPEAFLKTPAAAMYYGVILAANKKNAEATKYLELAGRAPSLMAEEKILINEARRQIR